MSLSLMQAYIADHYGERFVKRLSPTQVCAIYMRMIEREYSARKRSQEVKESDKIGYQFQLKDYM